MTEEEKSFVSIGRALDGVEQGQMFGKPCFKTNGKAFICFFQNEMVFKLKGDHLKEALNLIGSKLFDPSGRNRPMKEWVQVSGSHSDKWTKYAAEALGYLKEKQIS